MGLGAGTLRAQLEAANIELEPYPIALESEIRDCSVRRDFMSQHYGGSAIACFPSISAVNVGRTGHRNFMYPNLVPNPDAPMIPGAPGLFLEAVGCSAEEFKASWAEVSVTHKVLTRLGTNDFSYVGEYLVRATASLTREEWNAQVPQVPSSSFI